MNLDSMELMWDTHEVVTTQVEAGTSLEWKNVCAIRDKSDNCVTFGLLQYFYGNRTYYDEVVTSVSDLRTYLSQDSYPTGQEVNRDQIFGVYVTNDDDEIVSFEGTTIAYSVDLGETDALKWEGDFLDKLEGVDNTAYASLYFLANRSLSDVFGAAIGGDIILTTITYILMIIVTVLVLAKKYTWVESRTALSLMGILTVIFSMVAGYGLCAGLGVKFVPLHQVLPFVIIGIGVDDMFIIVAAFDAQDPSLPSEERMAKALRRCGIAITYTTVTDVVAFYLGALSSLPAIEFFCYYAATTVLFNFLFQITLFSALVCMDADRMTAKRLDVCCCITSGCCCGTAQEQTGSKEGDVGGAEGGAVGEYQVITTQPDEGSVGKVSPITLIMPIDRKDLNMMQLAFRDYYAPFITHPVIRVCVVIAFLALFAFGVYGCTEIEQGFDATDFAPDGSYVKEYFEQTKRLGLNILEQNTPVQIVYKDVNYHTQANQLEMLNIQSEFLLGGHNKGPFSSWIEDFIAWVPNSTYNGSVNSDGYLTDKSVFYQAVEVFVGEVGFTRYESDIIFINTTAGDSSTLAIETSRVSAYHIDMDTAMREVRAMEFARDVVDASSIIPTPLVFAPSYINIETELVIVNEMILNLVYALAAVVLISMFVLIRPLAVVIVALLVAMIDVELIGLMHFWDLRISSVTVVQLVMAVGLVVDYVSHVIHYYLAQPFSLTPKERLTNCLVEIGPAVLLGCSTTFLGTMPLAFADSVIFRTFFKMFFLIIVLGGVHGLVLLPAILPSIPFDDISPYLTLHDDQEDQNIQMVAVDKGELEEAEQLKEGGV
ncbi:patched [Ochromonadaceae sp. CCMP2298]|nr:patched [Ochromonadaceae sp. CCMP2298]